MNKQEIKLKTFSETDFDTLISWVKSEKELIQFAGTFFNYPLTKEQLTYYLSDSNRYVFKIIHNNTNKIIGHCEIYQTDKQNAKLCRIFIGEKEFRGKGYGSILTKILTKWGFDNLNIGFVSLNVYNFNIPAIKSYENVGFKIISTNPNKTKVNNEMWISYKMVISQEKFNEKNKEKEI